MAMTYLSQRSLGQAPDMEPALLGRMKANILAKIKAGEDAAALERYESLSKDDKFAVLMHLRAARGRGEITEAQLERFVRGEVSMPAMVISSWFQRHKLWVGAGVLAFAGYWYWSSKKKKKKRKS